MRSRFLGARCICYTISIIQRLLVYTSDSLHGDVSVCGPMQAPPGGSFRAGGRGSGSPSGPLPVSVRPEAGRNGAEKFPSAGLRIHGLSMFVSLLCELPLRLIIKYGIDGLCYPVLLASTRVVMLKSEESECFVGRRRELLAVRSGEHLAKRLRVVSAPRGSLWGTLLLRSTHLTQQRPRGGYLVTLQRALGFALVHGLRRGH